MRYFFATLKHKWFVLLASFRTGLPLWLALTHDLSKFSRHELPHYNWLHHQNCNQNDHHWEWWITRSDHSHGGSGAVNGCLPMSDLAITHMITDWLGAGRSYVGSWDISDWLDSHLPDLKVHPETMLKIVSELERLDLWHDKGDLFKVV